MARFQVIRTDNYNRETVSESFVCSGSEHAMKVVCNVLKEDPLRPDADWYRVAPIEEKLYKFEP